MKKTTLILLLAIGTLTGLAQYPLQKGENQLNAGFGFSSWGLPVYVGLDQGIHKDISIGFEGSFRSYREKWKDYRYNHTVFGLAGNFNYHFNSLFEMPSSPWDLYAGLSVGFYIWSSPNEYIGSHASGLGFSGQAGVRYFFNSKAAINFEAGGGSFSGGKIGVTIKL